MDELWVKLCQRQTFSPGTLACRQESLTADKRDEISVDSLEWMFERLKLVIELVKLVECVEHFLVLELMMSFL